MITQKFNEWTDLGYGEITIPISKNKGAKTAVIALIHFILLAAILLPVFTDEKSVALLLWILSGFYLLWNLVLDEYSGNMWDKLRHTISAQENQQGTWPRRYIRLTIPLCFTIIAVGMWCCYFFLLK